MIIKNFLNYMFLNFISVIMVIIMVLIGVAFLTLLERKILGYIQFRKGPNKVGMGGILQPFSDAIKLFNKEVFIINKSNYYLFYFCPIMMFLMMMFSWLMMPVVTNIYYMNYSLLILIIILTLMGYMLIFMGWSSNSLYSMIGAMRAIAQTLSYEVSFIMIILILMFLSESYSLIDFSQWQWYSWYMIIILPIFISFFVSVLAELNRSPMDFVEGESELVSGFNIEYMAGGFALIFMAEYGMIIFFSFLMYMMFINNKFILFNSLWGWMLGVMGFVCLIIFMRGLVPRMRYDSLMYLCWKIILPLVLNYLVFILSFKYMFMLLM